MLKKNTGKLIGLLGSLLFMCTSYAAPSFDCADTANQVISQAKSNHSKEAGIEYTPDMFPYAKICKAAIQAKNPGLTVEMQRVEGRQMMQFAVSND